MGIPSTSGVYWLLVLGPVLQGAACSDDSLEGRASDAGFDADGGSSGKAGAAGKSGEGGEGGVGSKTSDAGIKDAGDEQTQYLFVSANRDDTVRVYDLNDELPFKTKIDVCTNPAELRASKDGAHVSVVCRADSDTDNSSVWFIDADTLKVDKKFPVGKRITHSYVGPDGKTFFFGNDASGNVSIIDTDSWTQTRVTTGVGHHKIAFATDGQGGKLRYVYVSNITDETITAIDGENWSVVKNIQVGPSPHGMDYSFVSKKLYNCSNDAAHDIEIISTEGDDAQSVVGKIALETARCVHLEVSDDGKYVWASQNGANQIARVDVADNSVKYYDAGMGPDWFAFSEGKVWIADTQQWVVTSVNMNTGSVSAVPTTAGTPGMEDDGGVASPNGAHRGVAHAGTWVFVANQTLDSLSVIRADHGHLHMTLSDIPGASNSAVAGSKGGYPYPR